MELLSIFILWPRPAFWSLLYIYIILLYLHFVIATGNLVSQYCVKSSLHLALSTTYLSTNTLSRSFGLHCFSCYSLEFACWKDILALSWVWIELYVFLPSTAAWHIIGQPLHITWSIYIFWTDVEIKRDLQIRWSDSFPQNAELCAQVADRLVGGKSTESWYKENTEQTRNRYI